MQKLTLLSSFWFVACAPAPDPWAAAAIDYVIDRPQVVGIQVQPWDAISGEDVTLSALVIAPPDEEVSPVRWKTCGYSQEEWVAISDVGCLSEPDLVEPLGDGSPFAWTLPPMPTEPCDPGTAVVVNDDPNDVIPGSTAEETEGESSACRVNAFPLVAEAEVNGEAARGFAPLFVAQSTDDFRLFFPGADELEEPDDAEIAFEIDEAEVQAGDTVSIRAVGAGSFSHVFRWYIDAGYLQGTGRTAGFPHEDGWATENRLEIPEDYHGTLRVFVVFQPAEVPVASNQWAQLDLEIP